jgi:hypothetical protein
MLWIRLILPRFISEALTKGILFFQLCETFWNSQTSGKLLLKPTALYVYMHVQVYVSALSEKFIIANNVA